MNTSERNCKRIDIGTFSVHILDHTHATKFLYQYRSCVRLNTADLLQLSIDFSVYGTLDRIQQKEFENLRKKSFVSIPENAFKVETNRFNKRKWKRKYDSKPKSKKLQHSSLKPSNADHQSLYSFDNIQLLTDVTMGYDEPEVQTNSGLQTIPNLLLKQTAAPNFDQYSPIIEKSQSDMSILRESTHGSWTINSSDSHSNQIADNSTFLSFDANSTLSRQSGREISRLLEI